MEKKSGHLCKNRQKEVSTLSISPQKRTPCGQVPYFGIFLPGFKESPVAQPQDFVVQ